jgi:cupin fold WbuC family metalloprotein
MTEASRWIVQSEEVLYAATPLSGVTADDIAALKTRAMSSPRGRSRICLHADAGDPLHDMVVVHAKGIYVRPHKHPHKPEALIAMEGLARFVEFSEQGEVTSVSVMAPTATPVIRVPTNLYHALIIDSDFFVFCESTLGPFSDQSTQFAPWSPAEDDAPAVAQFIDRIADATTTSRQQEHR